MFNKNLTRLKPSATLAINTKVKSLKAEGNDITHFGFGQSPFAIHTSIVEELKKNASNNHYLPTLGLEELRGQIADFLSENQNIKTKRDLVFVGPGSKELLYQTILILEVTFLIPKGSWVSYLPQVKSKGGKFAILETEYCNNFKLTTECLENYCENNPEEKLALILNSPNNPTGAVYSEEEYKDLAVICRKHNITVLSDEIYSQLNFTQTSSPSIYKYYPERTIVFGGLSKVFSAGGYRLGFMVLPRELKSLKNTYKSLFSETFSAVSSPIQYAAIEAFKMSENLSNYINIQNKILKGISEYIFEEFSSINIECTISNGGFYMMIGFNNFKNQIKKLGLFTSEELANHFLDKLDVALLPASDFYFKEEELFFRLAFVDFNGGKVLKAFNENQSISEEFIRNNCLNIYNGVQKIKDFITVL